ncbi:MAG: oligosaccharide flippase family protein [Planctomycetota bacterium]
MDGGETAIASEGAAERAVPARVWEGAGLLTAGRLWAALCTGVVLVVLSRHLAAEEFGRFTFYLAILLLLDGLADFGTGAAVVQRSASEPRLLAPALAAARRLRLATTSACAALLAAPALALGEAEPVWVFLVALYPFSRVLELTSVVFQREMRWAVPVGVRAATAGLRLALSLLLVRAGVGSYGPFLAAHAGILAAGNVALHLLARRRLPPPAGPVAPLAGFLAAAAPLGAAGVCQLAYFHVDNLFVRGIAGEVELGRYNAAVRLLSFVVMIAVHATTVALPWLARRHRAGELAAATARLGRPLFPAACVGLGAMWPWSGRILAACFGAEFAAAAPSLRWLLVAGAIVYAGAGWLTALVAAGRTRAVLVLTAGALALNVAGNLWLVPLRGAEGAAIATVATELLVTAGAFHLVRRAGAVPAGYPSLWLAGPLLFAAAAYLAGRIG